MLDDCTVGVTSEVSFLRNLDVSSMAVDERTGHFHYTRRLYGGRALRTLPSLLARAVQTSFKRTIPLDVNAMCKRFYIF